MMTIVFSSTKLLCFFERLTECNSFKKLSVFLCVFTLCVVSHSHQNYAMGVIHMQIDFKKRQKHPNIKEIKYIFFFQTTL